MTSTTETTGHPDVTEISDLAEGLLAPSRSAEVRRHLDDCELCADVHSSLEEIRGLLGALPEPPRMPEDIARRIDAALAAEAVPGTTTDATDLTGPAEPANTTVTADAAPAGAEAPLVSRETPLTADRPSGHARTATTGPGRKSGKRGGRRRVAVLGAVLGAAALGLGGVLLSSLTGGSGPGPAAHGQSTAADTFAQGTLEQKVTDLLGRAQGSKAPNSLGIEGTTGSPRPRVYTEPTVPACVQKGIGRSDTALATEEGVYKGTDALLVLLPDTSDSTKVDAYLMDSTCVTDASAGPAKILLKSSYTRH
ncbi:anti-sigma factor [Streptomyces sp. NPDC005811]|uniref:anti-sigma factor family protein n=1 Tax=Streptomyces sp. NPDC005811 TaxID=3154565 RepID=UPI0033DD0CE5